MTNTIKIQDRIEPLVPEWEHLARYCNANPFLWPGWIGAWWHAYGKGHLQTLAAYQNGRLSGILPMQQNRGVLSSTTNSETPLFGFLAANEAAVHQLVDALTSQKARRIDLHLLHPVVEGISPARATADASGYRVITRSTQGSPYVTIEGTSWEAYESRLRGKFRRELRRRRRRLEEEGWLTLEVSDGTEGLDELLEEGLCVEGSGWKEAEGTSINARSATRRFYTEVAHWAAERGLLRLAFLRLDGRALAFDYCFEYNRTHYLVKTGFDSAYGRFAPGMIMRYLMLKRAFSEALDTYDFLGSFDTWKQEWTGMSRELQSLHMFAPTGLGLLDQATFVGVRSMSRRAKELTRSPIFPEGGRSLLEQAHANWHRNHRRKRTS